MMKLVWVFKHSCLNSDIKVKSRRHVHTEKQRWSNEMNSLWVCATEELLLKAQGITEELCNVHIKSSTLPGVWACEGFVVDYHSKTTQGNRQPKGEGDMRQTRARSFLSLTLSLSLALFLSSFSFSNSQPNTHTYKLTNTHTYTIKTTEKDTIYRNPTQRHFFPLLCK